MLVDPIERNLNCVRLRWHRDGTAQNKECALIPVESIRGVAHIVQGDQEIKIFHQSHERQKVSESLNGTEPGWSTEMFYFNRFYQNFLDGIAIQDQ